MRNVFVSVVAILSVSSVVFAQGICEGSFQKDPVKTVQCFEAVTLRKVNFDGPLLAGDAPFEEFHYHKGQERIEFDEEANFDDKTSQNYTVCESSDKYTLNEKELLRDPSVWLKHPQEMASIKQALAEQKKKEPNLCEVDRQCYFPNHPTKQNKIESYRWGNGGFFHLQRFSDDKWYIVKIR